MRILVSIVSAALFVAPAFALAAVARPTINISSVVAERTAALVRVPNVLTSTPPVESGQNGGASSGNGGNGGSASAGGVVVSGNVVSNAHAVNRLNSVLVRIGR